MFENQNACALATAGTIEIRSTAAHHENTSKDLIDNKEHALKACTPCAQISSCAHTRVAANTAADRAVRRCGVCFLFAMAAAAASAAASSVMDGMSKMKNKVRNSAALRTTGSRPATAAEQRRGG